MLFYIYETLVNFPHIASASVTMSALSMYLAHLELMYRSAVSSDCASSKQATASLILPACCTRERERSI